MIKTGKLLGRTIDDAFAGHDQPNTLVHALRACTVLLQAAGVNGSNRNNWQLASDSLVATMLVLKRLSSATALDKDGTHSARCAAESPDEPSSEKTARETIISNLVASELDELLGSNFATVVQNASILVPHVCKMLHHLHTSIHDRRRAIDYPDVQAEIKRAFETQRVVEKSCSDSSPSQKSFDVVPCMRATSQLDPGVLVVTDFQIFFTPSVGFEAQQQTVSVQTHATAIRASGAFGISILLDCDGVQSWHCT